MIHKIIKNSVQQLLIHGWNFILKSTFQLLCCLCVCAIPVHAFFPCFPTGINPGLWSLATVQAMGYPIHENASSSLINRLHTPLIHCHWAGFEMVLHHLLLCVQTLPPTPTQGQKCFQKRVCRLCATLSHHQRINIILNRK